MDKKRLERLFTIHQKLRTMQSYRAVELIETIAEKLGQHISDRTLRDDIEDLRNMGAEIPKREKSYGYTVPFSILERLDDSYYGTLNEALALLRQMAKSKEFVGLEDILLRLEQRISVTDAEKSASIHFEDQVLKGKEQLSSLHQAILKKQFLQVNYQIFNEPEAHWRHVFPLLLKEYNNRWFLIAWENGKPTPQNLPLDRIEDFRPTYEDFVFDKYFDFKDRFNALIGVTMEGTLETIRLRFSENRFPYIQTKKIHPSQQPIGEREVALKVYTNRELKSKILEFGADVEVLAPETLRDEIAEILQKAMALYQ